MQAPHWYIFRNEPSCLMQTNADVCQMSLLKKGLSTSLDYDQLLRDTHIMIVSLLQQNIVDLAHISH